MSICIPQASCGINDIYVSAVQGITFVITDETECIQSSADQIQEGEDCSGDTDACASGFVCAKDLVDQNGENKMSLCIAREECGLIGTYASQAQGMTFLMNDTVPCVRSWYDAFKEGEDCSSEPHGCGTGLVCALDIADAAEENQMSICVPAASCGVNGDYVSSEREITFAMTVEVDCIYSFADPAPAIAEGHDCSEDRNGCEAGTRCALNIVDENDENKMSICIPSDSCGVEGDYVSDVQAITFAIKVSDHCVKSKLDAHTEQEDCSTDIDGCAAGLVCALDIADQQGGNTMSICVPAESCGIEGDYISTYYDVEFKMTEEIECVLSSGDIKVEGEDCSGVINGCASNLLCNRNIIDSATGDMMSICLPSEYCGSNGDYESDVQETTFSISELNHCVTSAYDVFQEGEDCSSDTNGCQSGLVCAVDITDSQDEHQMTICIPEEECGVQGQYSNSDLDITFAMTSLDECQRSSADLKIEGEDCADDISGCSSGLVCARDIVDAGGENKMSVCIPATQCGVAGDYVSQV